MKTTIESYDGDLKSVLVMFEHKGVTHYREVNACLDEDGAYDERGYGRPGRRRGSRRCGQD
jgi:hypothetical protein